jgi:hypothetical protein
VTRSLTLLACLLAGTALLVSCGSDSVVDPGPDVARPTVTSVSIPGGETGAGLVDRISVTFSEQVDPATITPWTVCVSGRAPKGLLEYDASTRTATFTPDTLYAAQTWHALVVGDSLADLAGNLVVPDTTIFRTGIFDPWDGIDDHLEPNDEAASAAPIELGQLHRTLTVGAGQSARDFYRFTAGETTAVHAACKIRHAGQGEDLSLGFYDEWGSSLLEDSMVVAPGCTASLTCTLPPGTHLMSVGRDSFYGYVLYDLMLARVVPIDSAPARDR